MSVAALEAEQRVVVVSGLSLVIVGLLLLLVIQTLVARHVLRDARKHAGRVPGLDAAMAFGLPLVGIYAYRRSLKDTEAIARGDELESSRASTAPGRVGAGRSQSEDLLPRLTDELKIVRAELGEVTAERALLAVRVAELEAEVARLSAP